MESYQKLDQPLPTIQEVPESEVVATEAHIQERELEARERRLRDREADLEARERRLQELEDMEHRYLPKVAGQAAARRAAPEVSWPHEEAAKKTREAIRSMEAAEEAGGGEALGNARRLLEGPCAKSAASALMDLAQVAKSCDKEALGAVKAAERAVRDVVVLRCQSQDHLGDRLAFIRNAEEAFGQPLGMELQGTLSIAFLKIARYQARYQALAEAKAKAKAKAKPAPF